MSPSTKISPATNRALSVIDLDKVSSAVLNTSPYDYLITSDFIRPEWKEKLINSYPVIRAAGSFPLSTISCHPDFMQLIYEMNSDAFRRAIEDKFTLDLEGKPTMFTLRGRCRQKDGQIHTDSESKIITVLLYMNPSWEGQNAGRLRVLRSPQIDDYAAEISPEIGQLLVFRRCDHSYHGHLPFEGVRRVIQMNWVTHQKIVDQEQNRHQWSAFLKNLFPRK